MQMHEEEGGRLLQRDYTNVLVRIQTKDHLKVCEKISLLIISINELKSECAIFNQLTNEVMSDLNIFSLRVLNMILGDISGTSVDIVFCIPYDLGPRSPMMLNSKTQCWFRA